MKRFSKLVLAVAAVALVMTLANDAEARGRRRRPARRSCPGGTCRPQQSQLPRPQLQLQTFPEGAYTPLPANLLEPPLPTVVIEPADLVPTLSPRS